LFWELFLLGNKRCSGCRRAREQLVNIGDKKFCFDCILLAQLSLDIGRMEFSPVFDAIKIKQGEYGVCAKSGYHYENQEVWESDGTHHSESIQVRDKPVKEKIVTLVVTKIPLAVLEEERKFRRMQEGVE